MKKNKLFLMLLAFFAFGQMAWAQDQVSVSYVDENGTTQTHNAYKLDEFISVSPSGVNIGNTGFTNWYFVEGNNVVLNGQLGYYGGINLILCDGAKLTVNNTGGNAIQSLDDTDTKYTLTIYVQSQGTGQLVATATGNKAIQTENLTIHGGTISATGGAHGIYAPSSDIVINGGTVTASAPNGDAIVGYNVTINGGIVSATGNGGIKNGQTGKTILGYTNNTDRITATNYQNGYTASTRIKDGQYMITDNGVIVYGPLNQNKLNAIAGHTLSPYNPTEWEGSGDSADDPYIIASVDDLNLLSLRTNGSDNDYSGKYFKLGANITYTPSTTWNDATSTENNFTAISGFNGHFDGDGKTISGLRIFATDNYHDQNGFFSNLGPNAYIEDVTLSNARIAGQSQVGAIAGYVNEGAAVTNCHVTGTVTVHAYGHTLENHGGIVGANYGTVSNCVSEATITRSCIANDYGKTGGIAGANSGTLSDNKVFNVNITIAENYGAIAGLNDGGSLSNNYYHACTVNGTANTVNIGVNGVDITTSDGAMSIHTITKPNDVTITTEPTLVYGGTNYWKHGTTITLNGGLDNTPTAGWQKAYCINGVAISENSTTISHTFDMPAEDIEITIGEIHADWATSGAQGTEQDPYLIYFTDQLDLLATRVNNGTTYDGKYFKLMDDLTYSYNGLDSDESNYTPIGSDLQAFHGHFDGNNKSVSGIRIRKTGTGTDACYLGLFGSTDRAEVKDVTIKDTQIVGHRYLGGVVGHSWSTMVSGCHVWYTVSIFLANNDSNTAGGIVGYNRIYQTSTVTNCTSEVHIHTNTNSQCYNIGGIVGLNGSVVSNNFVMSAYIDGGSHFGAVVGQETEASALSNNYYRNCVVNNLASNVGCDGADVTDNDGAVGVYTITINAQDVILSSSNEPMVTYQGTDYWKSGQNIALEGGLNGTPAPGYQKAYFINGEAVTENTFVMPANDVSVTVGECHADWETANAGTEDDPYLIYFTDQLDLLASRTNNDPTKQGYVDKYFKLMNDLTYSYEGLGATESNYTPIGGSFNHFYGHFDGNNKTISGIRIYKGGTSQDVDDFQGLFGYMESWPPHGIGSVKNLTLDDAVITGRSCVGGIVGKLNAGTVDNCHVTSSVFIHTVVNNTYGHGGIAGDFTNPHSVISHCTSSATLIVNPGATDIMHYGGIVGGCYNQSTLTDNFAIGATVPGSTGGYSNGAITGGVSYSTLERNYYYGCKVASENVTPSGIGCGIYNGYGDPYDITEEDGAVPVFTLSVASGITAEAEVAFTRNDVNYYKLDTPVTLSYDTPAPDGSMLIYYVNGTAISGNSFNMTADANVTLAIEVIDWEAQYQGSEDDPYLIYTADQWNMLSAKVSNGNSYTDKYFKLMDDISVTTMVGASTTTSDFKYFSGIFDGNGHTLNVTYSSGSSEWRAPFSSIHNATIKNLHVAGSISTTGMRPAGIVSFVNGNSTIENCWSSVAISSSHNVDIDAGGIVSRVNEAQNLTLSGCLFTGSINYSNSDGFEGGGMIGWTQDNASTTLIDCYFAPSSINVKDKGSHYMFVSGKRDYLSLTNCYYNSVAAASHLDPQGNRARTITGGDNVVVAFAGSGNVYDVSGISGYDVGIVYDSVLYAGKSESVQVDLTYTGSIPAHTSPVYTVTNGSLSGITLTLNNSNDAAVTISYDHYETDNWSGTGTEDDPYLIYTEGQWILLADRVSNEDNPNSYSGKYFKLMEDISINENHDTYQNPYPKLVGYGERSFQGTFDGNGHTIVLSYKNKSYQYEQAIALFPSVKNATIKRLTVDGYIYRDVCPHGIAGIVGSSYGTTNLISCRSSVDVQNDGDISPYNANGGGLVAYVESGTLNMINCVFDGRLEGRSHTSTYAHLWSGMINYVRDGATANLINCLFNPEDIKFWDPGATATFARKHDNATVNLTNCYYKNGELGTTQGTSAIGWEAEQLLDALGYAWEYTSPAVFQPIMQPQTFTGEGSEGSPYQIATAEDWDKLATYVAHQDSHSSDHFQMTGDISTTSMVGLFDNLTFKGTFDGGGNTLTVNYEVTSMPDKEISTAAPFAFIENATITDLHTAGSITTAGMRPAGVAGFVVGNSTITNCKSEVTLTSSHNDDIDAGGFVARVNEDKSVTLTGCLFTGSITYSDPNGYEGGGMVGWTQKDASATLTNCVFAPSAINITKYVTSSDDKKHRMFVGGKERGDLTNCYYNGVAAASGMVAEGERVYDIIPGQNVTMQLYGIATDYLVSGITIYGTGDKGLKYDDAFHAVSGNVLDLNLGVTVPYTVSNYLANGEVITFDDTWNNYTLTMPEEDVTITATFSDVAWDGDGTEESPYLIYYNVQWDLLATNVNAGNNYNGVYFKLMDDISVETMVGSTNRAFRGIFDGGGHTLTFNKGTEASPYDQNFCAPFRAVEAATIKNLHTTGTIYTSAQHAAGFVAQVIPNSGNFTRFYSCRSSMKINSTVASDARSGGFIGSCSDALPSFTQVSNRLSIYFDDCLFDGEFSGTATGWGGFIGYYFWCSSAAGNSGMVYFSRCLFAPSAMNISTTDAYNFVRQDAWGWNEQQAKWVHFHSSSIMSIIKLYYTITCGNSEGYATSVGNMTNVQLRNALGDNWMIVTEDNVEKVVPTMGNVVTKTIAGYGDSNGGYALIASPVGTVNPAHVAHMLSNEYDLYRFNQAADLEWENYKANTFDLEVGKGYLYANSEDVTLLFLGTPYAGNGEVTLSRTDNTSADFQGWNLVGNPFNEIAYIADGRSFYTMNEDGSEIIVASNPSIEAMEGVFVIANYDEETMTFTTTAPQNNNGKGLALNISNGKSGVIDRAIVRFGEGNQQRNLPKFQINRNSTKVYIPMDGQDYAVVRSEGMGELPVSFKAAENGNYTLSFTAENAEFSYLHLIDHMTGNDVDLLQTPSYNFDAQYTDIAARFKLVFAKGNADMGDDFGFIDANGNLLVLGIDGTATLQVVDVTGRVLSSETFSGNYSKPVKAAAGVYMLRLIQGNDSRTQKIVVK